VGRLQGDVRWATGIIVDAGYLPRGAHRVSIQQVRIVGRCRCVRCYSRTCAGRRAKDGGPRCARLVKLSLWSSTLASWVKLTRIRELRLRSPPPSTLCIWAIVHYHSDLEKVHLSAKLLELFDRHAVRPTVQRGKSISGAALPPVQTNRYSDSC